MGPLVHADVLDLKPYREPSVRGITAVGPPSAWLSSSKGWLVDAPLKRRLT
jgi:hypothetical protein